MGAVFFDPFVLVGEAMAYKSGIAEEPTNIDSLTANKDLRLGLVQGSAELKFTTAEGIPISSSRSWYRRRQRRFS